MGQLQLLRLSIAFLQTVKCFFIKKICTPIIIPILMKCIQFDDALWNKIDRNHI